MGTRIITEQIIRPTGLLEPEIIIRPLKNQIDDLIEEIRLRVIKKERILVTTLTKKMAEDRLLPAINNYSKEEIFEFYVNRIFFGNRAYGIAAASEVYYGKALSELNLAQWAMIAALPKAPSSMNPLVNPRRALLRRNWILQRMLDLEFIHTEQFTLPIDPP